MPDDKKSKRGLFGKLTRLFRSGPVVKRKIRTIDTAIAMPDKTKSSGTLLFQRSLAPTYATITANAYNLSERLMRYQDFQEMEYSLAFDTLIATPDGFKTIGELAEECAKNPDHTFIVYSYDHEHARIVPALAKQARQTCVDHAWKVTFDNGRTITASPEHRLMLRDSSYRRVEDLQPGDAMMPFYRKDLFAGAEEGTSGYSWVYTMDNRFRGWTKEHQLIAEWVAGRELTEDEVVHHINFTKSDNRPENLRIMTKSDHDSYHTSLNNAVKWAPENREWIEEFKRNHAQWMRDHAPTARHDVTFARILETAERVGFSMPVISAAMDVTWNLILERLVANGFSNFTQFVQAYRDGQISADVEPGRPGLLTRDLSIDLIKSVITQYDTKRSLCIKLGCTVNVLDKFFARRAQISWGELRASLGFDDQVVVTSQFKSVRAGGRPKGSNGNDLTFQQICDAYESGLTLPRLVKKLNVNKNTVISRLAQNGYPRYSDFQTGYDNCKVVSIEYVGVMPLYDLTVDGYKNFATDTVVSHNTPEIAAALDIYADETCAQDEHGRVLHVYSNNERVKQLLEELFYNTLNVEFNLRSWSRNLPVHKDTVVPLLDGRNVPIWQLAEEYVAGKQNWVYSVQDKTHKMVPGKIAWCGLTRKDSELVRVWLDDETYVDCAPDHEWVLRDGGRKRADELVEGESLMPFYRKTSSRLDGSRMDGYEEIYDPKTNRYVYTHRRVAEVLEEGTLKEGRWLVTHHYDFDKRNNDPANLVRMDEKEHMKLHQELAIQKLRSPEVTAKRMAGIDRWLRSDVHRALAREQLKELQARRLMKTSWEDYNSSPQARLDDTKRVRAMKELWADPDRRARCQASMAIKFDQKCIDLVVERLAAHGKYISPKVLGNQLKTDEVFMGYFRSINVGTKRDLTRALNSHAGLESLLQKVGVSSYIDLVKQYLPQIASTPWFKRAEKKSQRMSGVVPAMREYHTSVKSTRKNHKVVRVEKLEQTSDVYCMEVLGSEGEHDRHNFAVVSMGGTIDNGIFVGNCKYGDFFLYNDVSPEYGVINVIPIPVNEIEREENFDRDDPFAVRYRWVSLANRILENWEVTHFRAIGNDMFLPYGASVIEPARRVWRQLILIEDAMLVYRIVRAPERRVFYIDVANTPAENVQMYIEEQKKNLRTQQVIDQRTGRVDLRYNPLCISLKTLIKLQDGRNVSLDGLIREWDEGKRNQWVYSIDPQTKRYVPGKVIWAGVTKRDAELVRVHLDDATWRDVTPDHRFMLRDGTYKRADELLANDSLMPLYSRLSSKATGDKIEGYEQVYDPASCSYVFTHRRNASCGESDNVREDVITSSPTVHHVDFNKLNNTPNNLKWMDYVEHRRYHTDHCNVTLNSPAQLSARAARLAVWNRSEDKIERVRRSNLVRNSVAAMADYNFSELHKQHNVQRSSTMKELWSNDDRRNRAQTHMRYVMTDLMFERLTAIVTQHPKLGRAKIHALLMSDSTFVAGLQTQALGRDVSKYSVAAWEGELVRRGYAKLPGFRNAIVGYRNHTVVRVEKLSERQDTGCITVEKWHNFAAGPTVEQLDNTLVSNSWILLHNSVEEDYFIPVRGAESGTKIETLAGGQNTAAVEDVAYIQKKLFAALKIPRAYLGYDDMLSCLTGDTQVPLLSGGTVSLHDLASFDWSKERDVWVYSTDLEGNVKPGRVSRAWSTKQVDVLHHVTLDNGEVVKCTANHPFLCRDGVYRRADELVVGQSLMPVYRRTSSKKDGDLIDGYDMVWQNDEWVYTHKVIYGATCGGQYGVKKQRVIHHKDFNKLNNVPSNLQEMTWYEHRRFHANNLKTTLFRPDVVAKREPARIAALKGTAHRAQKSVQLSAQHADPNSKMSQWVHGDDISTVMSKQMVVNWQKPAYRQLKSQQSRDNWNNPEYREKLSGQNHWLSRKNSAYTLESFADFCNENGIQTRSQFLRLKEKPVGWRYVNNLFKANGYKGWNDFAACWILKNHKVVSVKVVELAEPVWVYDLEVEKYHNFLIQQGVQVHNSKATLAQEDIRFSRTISVLQKTIISELNKVAIIHLYVNGYDGDELLNFTLHLSNPSTIAVQQKLELWRTRLETAAAMPEGLGSKNFIRRDIWGLSSDRCEEIDNERLDDKLIDAAVEAAGAGAGGAGGEEMGGLEDLGLGGEETSGEEAGAETAGVHPPELQSPELQLLTMADDEEVKALGAVDGVPVKPNAQAKAQHDLKYDRTRAARRRAHGQGAGERHHMPNLGKMVQPDSDPSDTEWLRSVTKNPFGENVVTPKVSLSQDLVTMLSHIDAKLGVSSRRARSDVLSENVDIDEIVEEIATAELLHSSPPPPEPKDDLILESLSQSIDDSDDE